MKSNLFLSQLRSEQLEEQKESLEDAFEAKMKNYQEYVKFYYQQSSADEEGSESDDEMCDGEALVRNIILNYIIQCLQ